jgi:hypothetical protein
MDVKTFSGDCPCKLPGDPSSRAMSGPPESPWQASTLSCRSLAQIFCWLIITARRSYLFLLGGWGGGGLSTERVGGGFSGPKGPRMRKDDYSFECSSQTQRWNSQR